MMDCTQATKKSEQVEEVSGASAASNWRRDYAGCQGKILPLRDGLRALECKYFAWQPPVENKSDSTATDAIHVYFVDPDSKEVDVGSSLLLIADAMDVEAGGGTLVVDEFRRSEYDNLNACLVAESRSVGPKLPSLFARR